MSRLGLDLYGDARSCNLPLISFIPHDTQESKTFQRRKDSNSVNHAPQFYPLDQGVLDNSIIT